MRCRVERYKCVSKIYFQSAEWIFENHNTQVWGSHQVVLLEWSFIDVLPGTSGNACNMHTVMH
jgi:hypothetical protein